MLPILRVGRSSRPTTRLLNSPHLTRTPTTLHRSILRAHLSQTTPSHFSTSALSRNNAVAGRPSLFRLDNATILPFGRSSAREPRPTFENLSLDIKDDGSCWAILSTAQTAHNTANLLHALQDQAKFHPREAGGFPFLATLPRRPRPDEQGGPREATVQDAVKLVSFKTRLAGSGGEFQDYSARYGAIRDEDKLTLRDHLRSQRPWTGESDEAIEDDIQRTAKALEMEGFLDLPMITLSNGQTRRARIVGALLEKPELLILEEPFTGLDVGSRALLSSHLGALHATRAPRILFILRPQDPIPDSVTHLILPSSTPGHLTHGTKADILATPAAQALLAEGERARELTATRTAERKAANEAAAAANAERAPVVQLRDVNIAYGPNKDRPVLSDITWTVREGERWVLAGHNGSGKSTLLSLVLGDHPQSYVEDIELFGKPRSSLATPTLQANIGHTSPEIFNAFPRKHGRAALTAAEAVGTGFHAHFVYHPLTEEQQAKLDNLVARFPYKLTPEFLGTHFIDLSPGQQSLVLLLRALVKEPKLLVLDEPFSGMDGEMVARCKDYLEKGLRAEQAVVMISHFEEELPEGLGRVLRLEKGRVAEVV